MGCCLFDTGSLDALAAAGVDYCEMSVADWLMQIDEVGAARAGHAFEKAGLPCLVCNRFLPEELKIVGSRVDTAAVSAYMRGAVARMRRLGVAKVVVGSGPARHIPDAYPREKAVAQLRGFFEELAEVAGEAGVTVMLEPLRRAETNIINTHREAIDFIRESSTPGLKLICDNFHLEAEKEDVEHLEDAGDLIDHVHIRDSGLRPPGEGDFNFSPFLSAIRKAGYSGTCSIESVWDDLDEQIGPAVAFVRDEMTRAGW